MYSSYMSTWCQIWYTLWLLMIFDDQTNDPLYRSLVMFEHDRKIEYAHNTHTVARHFDIFVRLHFLLAPLNGLQNFIQRD